MINHNREFADALRRVLVGAGMTTEQINTAVAGELREVTIEEAYPLVIAGIGTGMNLRASVIHEIQHIHGVFTPATSTWDLGPTNVSPVVRGAAVEDLGAICRYGNTAQFDAAKAVTNILRLIKAAERL